MNKYKYVVKTNQSDINLFQCGEEECSPGHKPAQRFNNYYLLHIVYKGKGKFISQNKTYEIEENQAFLIPPNYSGIYMADNIEPWNYFWIAFDGFKAKEYMYIAGFSNNNLCIKLNNPQNSISAIKSLINETKKDLPNELALIGQTYMFFASICSNTNFKYDDVTGAKLYINEAKKYISDNIKNKITVNLIASKIGIDRSYLYSLFKKELHISPKEYIIEEKISHAKKMLQTTNLTVSEIAIGIGYSDQFTFSRLFKAKTNLSPSEYKNKFNPYL